MKINIELRDPSGGKAKYFNISVGASGASGASGARSGGDEDDGTHPLEFVDDDFDIEYDEGAAVVQKSNPNTQGVKGLCVFPEDNVFELSELIFLATGVPLWRQHIIGSIERTSMHTSSMHASSMHASSIQSAPPFVVLVNGDPITTPLTNWHNTAGPVLAGVKLGVDSSTTENYVVHALNWELSAVEFGSSGIVMYDLISFLPNEAMQAIKNDDDFVAEIIFKRFVRLFWPQITSHQTMINLLCGKTRSVPSNGSSRFNINPDYKTLLDVAVVKQQVKSSTGCRNKKGPKQLFDEISMTSVDICFPLTCSVSFRNAFASLFSDERRHGTMVALTSIDSPELGINKNESLVLRRWRPPMPTTLEKSRQMRVVHNGATVEWVLYPHAQSSQVRGSQARGSQARGSQAQSTQFTSMSARIAQSPDPRRPDHELVVRARWADTNHQTKTNAMSTIASELRQSMNDLVSGGAIVSGNLPALSPKSPHTMRNVVASFDWRFDADVNTDHNIADRMKIWELIEMADGGGSSSDGIIITSGRRFGPPSGYDMLYSPQELAAWDLSHPPTKLSWSARSSKVRFFVSAPEDENMQSARRYTMFIANSMVSGTDIRGTGGHRSIGGHKSIGHQIGTMLRPVTRAKESMFTNSLQRLQMEDPVLYKPKPGEDKDKLYSVRCQKKKQPWILSNGDYQKLSQKDKNAAIKYWNFTNDEPAYYMCPKAFPHANLFASNHPEGYCMMCCNMQKPRPESQAAKINAICHAKHKITRYDEEQIIADDSGSVRHVLGAGKDIPPGRLGMLDHSVASFLGSSGRAGSKFLALGVDQGGGIVPPLICCCAAMMSQSIDEFLPKFVQEIRGVNDEIATDIWRAYETGTPLATFHMAQNWTSIISDTMMRRWGVVVVQIVDTTVNITDGSLEALLGVSSHNPDEKFGLGGEDVIDMGIIISNQRGNHILNLVNETYFIKQQRGFGGSRRLFSTKYDADEVGDSVVRLFASSMFPQKRKSGMMNMFGLQKFAKSRNLDFKRVSAAPTDGTIASFTGSRSVFAVLIGGVMIPVEYRSDVFDGVECVPPPWGNLPTMERFLKTLGEINAWAGDNNIEETTVSAAISFGGKLLGFEMSGSGNFAYIKRTPIPTARGAFMRVFGQKISIRELPYDPVECNKAMGSQIDDTILDEADKTERVQVLFRCMLAKISWKGLGKTGSPRITHGTVRSLVSITPKPSLIPPVFEGSQKLEVTDAEFETLSTIVEQYMNNPWVSGKLLPSVVVADPDIFTPTKGEQFDIHTYRS